MSAPSPIPAAPSPPPPLPPVLPPPTSPPLPASLKIGWIVVGAVQFGLALIAPAGPWTAENAAYRTGALLGATVIWPLIIIGLFSIGRKFRTTRSRVIIMTVVWLLFCLGHLATLSQQRLQQRRTRGPARSVPTKVEIASAVKPAEAPTSLAPSMALLPRPDDDTPHDFSPGSDERLIKVIERAQEHRYHEVVAAYAHACKTRPRDARLALERVRFVEHFASAEDFTIESAASDLEAAVDHLKRRFPSAPEAVLYELEGAFDDEFEAAANRHAHVVSAWSVRDQARYFLLRANAATTRGESRQVKHFALRSFTSHPTAEAALLLARRAHDESRKAESLTYLQHAVLKQAEPWQKKQQMDLLFDLGHAGAAAELYADIAASSPALVNTTETALRLARGGQLEAARRIFDGLPVNDWNRARMARQRFAFELDFGTAAQAGAAYRTLRDTGIGADPFFRDRTSLLLKHPGLAWSVADVVGLALLVLLFAVAALFPLGMLVPVHYWSLVRQRRTGVRPASGPGWGLRQAWIALGVLTVTEFVLIWSLQPEWLRSWWNDAAVETAIPDGTLLLRQWVVWLALACVLCLLLWGAGKWRLLRPGTWRLGKTIGMALGVALVLRIGLMAYAVVWPEAIFEPVARFDSQTRQLCNALLRTTGPFGLIAAIAVLVPILEELLFRGVLLDALAKHIPFGWANALQALVFAAVHENYRILPFFVAFGIAAGLLTRRSGSLLPAMVMHGANNLIVVLAIIGTHR